VVTNGELEVRAWHGPIASNVGEPLSIVKPVRPRSRCVEGVERRFDVPGGPERAIGVSSIVAGDVTADDLLQRGASTVDVAHVVVATEADPDHPWGPALVAMAHPIDLGHRGGVVEIEEMGDLRMGAEAPAAHADAVLVAEDCGDQAVFEPVDGERDDAELGCLADGMGRSVDPQAGNLGQAIDRVPRQFTLVGSDTPSNAARRPPQSSAANHVRPIS
jgi:hypothetical protein